MKTIYKIGLYLGCFLFSITNSFAQDKPTAEEILAKMTPEQKIKELNGVDDYVQQIFLSAVKKGLTNKSLHSISGGNKKLGIPQLRFTDGHKGVTNGGKWTVFPSTLLRAATFDIELEHKVGLAYSSEAEAAGADLMGGCTVNILRNPRGGRSEESYGEDPFLAGEMGVQLVKGVQESGKVMAMAKHFAMNSIENNRFNVNAITDERTLREVYIPQFEKMVKEGKVSAVMSAYNRVNGVYCAENDMLLNDILREEWGFDGFVMSDWVYGVHSTAKSMKAGLNIEMPMRHYYSQDSIMAAIENKQITWEDVDNAVLQVLRKKLAYGENKPHKLDKEVRKNDEMLSQEVAEKGMILLKNDNVLPFSTQKVKNVVLVGELAKYNNLGEAAYLPDIPRRWEITPYDGVKNFFKGTDVNVWCTDGKNKDEFEKLVSRADAVIVCVGFTSIDEGENFHTSEGIAFAPHPGGDRDNMNLHQDDINLINLTSRHTRNMAVVVFGGGTPVVSQWISRASALLVAGIPGQNGGHALANILFGKVSPSGKLPYSIYVDENDYPAFPHSHLQMQQPWEINESEYVDPYDVDYGYYFGYTLADKENIPVSFPFGYGLSYTSFKLDNINTDKNIYNTDDLIKVTCKVTNTGEMKGGETVQVYVGFENAKIDRPIKALKGFEKVYLNPGESKNIEVEIPMKELAYWDVDSKSWKVEKVDYSLYVGNSSRNEDLQELHVSVH